jgi:hypothetical protein
MIILNEQLVYSVGYFAIKTIDTDSLKHRLNEIKEKEHY